MPGSPRLLVDGRPEGASSAVPLAPPRLSAEQLGEGTVANSARRGSADGASLRSLGRRCRSQPPSRTFARARLDDRGTGSCLLHLAEAAGASQRTFAQGLREGGVLATAKHFPGLGGAVGNTDPHAREQSRPTREPPAPTSPRSAGSSLTHPLVMLSNAVYPAYGSQPAAAVATRPGAPPQRTSASTGTTISVRSMLLQTSAPSRSRPLRSVPRPARSRPAALHRERGSKRQGLRRPSSALPVQGTDACLTGAELCAHPCAEAHTPG